jgi:hypothetical protein
LEFIAAFFKVQQVINTRGGAKISPPPVLIGLRRFLKKILSLCNRPLKTTEIIYLPHACQYRDLRCLWSSSPQANQEDWQKIQEATGEKLCTFYLMQSISMAIQRGNAASVRGCPKRTSSGLEGLFNFHVQEAEML